MTNDTDLIVYRSITCPSCWQDIDVALDLSVPEQQYVEDCSVCCRPIVIHCRAENGALLSVSAAAENE
jgi:hypothetical protein